MSELDVLIVGTGPAGLAAAAALGDWGVRVGVLGTPGATRWPARYGAWHDELAGLGLADTAACVWPDTEVGFGAAGRRRLGRAYALLDNRRLAAALLERCETGRACWIPGRAAAVWHNPARSVVRLRDGREVRARVVVDASGHRPALVHPGNGSLQGFQTALGWTLDVDRHPFTSSVATLMDWDDRCFERDAVPAPSFLYAMPMPDGRVFVEETVLVARPAIAPPLLEARLRRRCSALGIATDRIVETEQVWIPMGGALPSLNQRVVGFGAAAGMVHPATGYLLPRALGTAPALADALVGSLGAGEAPARAARCAWDALWPADRRRRHALLRFGMEILLGLDARQMREFFGAFFGLPDADWHGYLGDTLQAGKLARVMAAFFAHAPPPVRTRLIRGAGGPAGVRLAATLAATIRPGVNH